MKLYLIGSLRNPRVPELAAKIRELGINVFDDWYSAGKDADDHWRDYERGRGHNLPQALDGLAARHVFEFDKKHLEESDVVVLLMPAGKSAHLELGWAMRGGSKGYVLLDQDPERYDVMYCFCDQVFLNEAELLSRLELDREERA